MQDVTRTTGAERGRIRAAAATPGTWVGFCGSVVVALGVCGAPWAGANTWLAWPYAVLRDALSPSTSSVLVMTGVALLILAWWLLRPRGSRRATDPRLALALWAVPLAACPVVLSFDAYGYADLGWTLLHGLDPYTVGLGTTGSPYLPGVAPALNGVRWGYPGLGIAINGWAAALTGFHPYWGVVAQRLPAWAGVALMAFSLPRIASAIGVSSEMALWFGLLNPIVVLHLLGGAHNDALMAGLGLLALDIAITPHRRPNLRFVVASVVLGVALAVKPQAGLLAVAIAGVPVRERLQTAAWWPRVRLLALRTAACVGVAVTAFLSVSYACGAGIGWISLLDRLDILVTISPTDVVAAVAARLGADPAGSRAVAEVVFQAAALLVVLALALLRTKDPLAIAAWGSVAIVLGAPALHPWYLCLPLALVALQPLSRRAWFVAATAVVAYPVAAYTAAMALKAM